MWLILSFSRFRRSQFLFCSRQDLKISVNMMHGSHTSFRLLEVFMIIFKFCSVLVNIDLGNYK